MHRSNEDDVQFAGSLVAVPDILELGINSRVYAEKFLKFIDY
jgi:hypothetical protein